jgi:hypothetical protein
MDKPVSEMNKQELRDYAKQTFGVALDMRKPVEALQEQVGKLTPKGESKPDAPKVKAKATHLKNPVTGFWWPWHKLLAERGDLIPCDENGNVVE